MPTHNGLTTHTRTAGIHIFMQWAIDFDIPYDYTYSLIHGLAGMADQSQEIPARSNWLLPQTGIEYSVGSTLDRTLASAAWGVAAAYVAPFTIIGALQFFCEVICTQHNSPYLICNLALQLLHALEFVATLDSRNWVPSHSKREHHPTLDIDYILTPTYVSCTARVTHYCTLLNTVLK